MQLGRILIFNFQEEKEGLWDQIFLPGWDSAGGAGSQGPAPVGWWQEPSWRERWVDSMNFSMMFLIQWFQLGINQRAWAASLSPPWVLGQVLSHHSSRQSQQWALACFSLGYLPLNTNYLSYQSPVMISLGAQTHPYPSAQSILQMNSPNLINVQWHRALVGSTEPHQQGVHPAKHRAIIWNKFNWIKFWLNAINMIDLVTYPLYDGLFNLFFHSEKGCCIDPKH